MKNRIHLSLALALAAGLAPRAHAADDPQVLTAGVAEMDFPGDAPGHEKAPRTTAENAQAPEPAKPADEREWMGGLAFHKWSRLTGDWGGFRTRMEDAGLTLSGSYTVDWTSVVDGGVTGGASSRHILDINAALDLDKAFGWKGATLFADWYLYAGRGGSAHVGDLGGVSTIDGGDDLQQLGELWFEQKFASDVLRVKLGKMDAAKEFDFLDCTGGFLNTGAVQDAPSLPTLPTYPNPALGAVIFVYPAEQFYAGVGLFDGATAEGFRTGGNGLETFFSDDDSDAWFWIGEAGFTWDMGENGDAFEAGKPGAGRFALGVWHSTADFTDFSGNPQDGLTGGYALFEQQIWRNGSTEDDSGKGLFGFARAGFSDGSVNAAELSLAAGLTLEGTLSSRPDDSAGFLVNWIDLSDDAAAGFADDEMTFEVFYKVGVTPFVFVTPDVQYIMNPSGDSTVDDAIQVGVRVGVTF